LKLGFDIRAKLNFNYEDFVCLFTAELVTLFVCCLIFEDVTVSCGVGERGGRVGWLTLMMMEDVCQT
jgi:hypothetical protein